MDPPFCKSILLAYLIITLQIETPGQRVPHLGAEWELEYIPREERAEQHQWLQASRTQ